MCESHSRAEIDANLLGLGLFRLHGASGVVATTAHVDHVVARGVRVRKGVHLFSGVVGLRETEDNAGVCSWWLPLGVVVVKREVRLAMADPSKKKFWMVMMLLGLGLLSVVLYRANWRRRGPLYSQAYTLSSLS